MIISHEHKFIFLKTRKTAGTSVEIALSRFCGEKDVITPISSADEGTREKLRHRGPQNFHVDSIEFAPKDWRHLFLKRKKARYYNHIPAEEVRSLIGTKVWNEYFKFCFERNPWDKAISLYFWRTRGREPRPTLLEFLRSVNETRLSNFGIYGIDGDLAVDHAGLYEDLDSELERIAALLKLPEEIKLPRAKGTSREDKRPYRDIIGQEERSIIERVCAREIAHFGYSF
jgi:hypothetical protein